MRNSTITLLAAPGLAAVLLTGCGGSLAVTPAAHTATTAPATVVATAPATVPATAARATPAATAPAAPAAPATQAPPANPPQLINADAVVTQFYQDITDQNYQAAWALGGDNIGGTNYTAWVAGYGTTASIALGSFSAFGSGQVQVELIATQSDGTVKTFTGTYTVENGVITAASIIQNS